MKTRFESWIAIIGLAATTVACGNALPTATTVPAGPDTQGIASASGRVGGSRIEPRSCPGELALFELASDTGWTTMEAAIATSKDQKSYCQVPTFSVKPEATLVQPRFNPHQVTIVAEKPGFYNLTATIGTKSVSATVIIK